VYVECRKKISALERWVSVCVLGSVFVSVCCFRVCFRCFSVRFYVV